MEQQHPIGEAFTFEVRQIANDRLLNDFLSNECVGRGIEQETLIENRIAMAFAQGPLYRLTAIMVHHICQVRGRVATMSLRMLLEDGEVLFERKHALLLLEGRMHFGRNTAESISYLRLRIAHVSSLPHPHEDITRKAATPGGQPMSRDRLESSSRSVHFHGQIALFDETAFFRADTEGESARHLMLSR